MAHQDKSQQDRIARPVHTTTADTDEFMVDYYLFGPWSTDNIALKFYRNFVTGRASYGQFASGLARGVVHVPVAGGPAEVTLLPRDLLFIIDMSGSISASEWSLLKRKLADVIERLCGSIGKGPKNNRIAVITFSSRVVLNFDFRTHWTIASLRRAILAIPQDAQASCTGDALLYAHNYMFEPDSGIRPVTESVKEVLVLTDGLSNCGASLPLQAQRLQIKALVFVLAIGSFSETGKEEIESMVSRPSVDHIFSLKNFVSFGKMVDAMLQLHDQCVPYELK